MKALVALFALALLLGCVGPVDQSAQADFYYGDKPANLRERVTAYFEANLREPQTARYSWGSAGKAHYRDGLVLGGKLHQGWAQEVQVNARNGYGGYTGFQRYVIMVCTDTGATVDITDSLRAGMAAFSPE